MGVLITGATGLIGRALAVRLLAEGWKISAWVRSPERARAALGAECEVVPVERDDRALTACLGTCEAVVNLAGESILGPRWSAERKAALRDSRVAVTQRLVRAMAAAEKRPSVLVSGSGSGYYGDCGTRELDESSPAGRDFLAQLCVDWEAAAMGAEALGVRVVTSRTGAVLAAKGGALGQMLPAYRLGLGGPVAGGRQYLPWIHIEDMAGVISTALRDERYRGPINAVAPEAVTNREFSKALGRALRRPAVVPLPAAALRLIFGEAAQVLLASQRAVPRRLEELGYRFQQPRLDAALRSLV